jgi:hypothetical protein
MAETTPGGQAGGDPRHRGGKDRPSWAFLGGKNSSFYAGLGSAARRDKGGAIESPRMMVGWPAGAILRHRAEDLGPAARALRRIGYHKARDHG